MTRALWIPDRLRKYGVPFQLTTGWEERGGHDWAGAVVVCHHDALRSTLAGAAIVRMMIEGRTDLVGPLCNVWIDDDYDATAQPGDPMVYVIASGTSHNAGSGSWHGVSGNNHTLGIEARNTGVGEAWSTRMLDVYERTAAALLDGMGRDATMCCGHKEWAPTRKIDPAGIDMRQFRINVASHLSGGGAPPPLPPHKATDMPSASVTHFDGHHEHFDVFAGSIVHDWQAGRGSPTWSGWQTLDTGHRYTSLVGATVEHDSGNVNVFARYEDTGASGIAGLWYDGTWHGPVPAG